MRAGRLRTPVTIEQATATRDSRGAVIQTWAPIEYLWWASVEPLTGAEYMQAQQIASTATHRVRIRYKTDLDTTYRLKTKTGSRVFNIAAVLNPDERDAEQELLCREDVT